MEAGSQIEDMLIGLADQSQPTDWSAPNCERIRRALLGPATGSWRATTASARIWISQTSQETAANGITRELESANPRQIPDLVDRLLRLNPNFSQREHAVNIVEKGLVSSSSVEDTSRMLRQLIALGSTEAEVRKVILSAFAGNVACKTPEILTTELLRLRPTVQERQHCAQSLTRLLLTSRDPYTPLSAVDGLLRLPANDRERLLVINQVQRFVVQNEPPEGWDMLCIVRPLFRFADTDAKRLKALDDIVTGRQKAAWWPCPGLSEALVRLADTEERRRIAIGGIVSALGEDSRGAELRQMDALLVLADSQKWRDYAVVLIAESAGGDRPKLDLAKAMLAPLDTREWRDTVLRALSAYHVPVNGLIDTLVNNFDSSQWRQMIRDLILLVLPTTGERRELVDKLLSLDPSPEHLRRAVGILTNLANSHDIAPSLRRMMTTQEWLGWITSAG
ncbi:MAG: hypothetical protein LBG99_02315 [Propionibacteriaceae bacterium]|jgi:hypothetical protein|nr:hypothetical protein [Propionibacteriaceae bacterium]